MAGKRNPEQWGSYSGLNRSNRDPYNRRRTPEHNVRTLPLINESAVPQEGSLLTSHPLKMRALG